MNLRALPATGTWTTHDLLDHQFDWGLILKAKLVEVAGSDASDLRALTTPLALVRRYTTQWAEPMELSWFRDRLTRANLLAAKLDAAAPVARGERGQWDRQVRRRVRMQTDAQVVALLNRHGSGLRLARVRKSAVA